MFKDSSKVKAAMKKDEVLLKIKETRIVPVVRTDSADKARMIITALIKGGIDVLEITMTIPGAIELIDDLNGKYKNSALIGAGTVLDKETARRCVEAGAKFIVSPIADSATISFCNQNEIVVMPGALTPTEIFNARLAGADIIKVFPVSTAGGAAYIKAVKTVFPHIEMIPTGGITLENAAEYIKAGALAVGMGGELTKGAEVAISENAQKLGNTIKQVD